MNNFKIRLKFKRRRSSCLKQEEKAAFTLKNVVHLFIVCKLDTCSRDLNTDFTFKNCLFDHYLTVAWEKMQLFLELI